MNFCFCKLFIIIFFILVNSSYLSFLLVLDHVHFFILNIVVFVGFRSFSFIFRHLLPCSLSSCLFLGPQSPDDRVLDQQIDRVFNRDVERRNFDQRVLPPFRVSEEIRQQVVVGPRQAQAQAQLQAAPPLHSCSSQKIPPVLLFNISQPHSCFCPTS